MAVVAKPVVVGVDGSEESARALRWAARYAELVSAPLQPLLAWEVPASYGGQVRFEDVDFEKVARARLEQVVHEVLGELPVALMVERAHPAAALIDASRDAAVLVVGQRGRGEFHDRLLGSVSQHCVHHAHCPVVVVRGE